MIRPDGRGHLLCATLVRRGDDWHGKREPCGNKAKGVLADGSPACGVHLRQESEATRRVDARSAWEARIATVNEALGIHCFGWEIDHAVSMNIADLERLAAQLGQSDGSTSQPSETTQSGRTDG